MTWCFFTIVKSRKLETARLGPYIIKDIRPTRVVQLSTLHGKLLDTVVNSAWLKKHYPLKKKGSPQVKTPLRAPMGWDMLDNHLVAVRSLEKKGKILRVKTLRGAIRQKLT